MSSWGDAKDEWRGLKPYTTHTVPFSTSFGIPNLWHAFLNHSIPPAAKRLVDLKELDDQRKSLHKIHELYPKFEQYALDDCLNILKLYEGTPKPFRWKRADIEAIFSTGPGTGAKKHARKQQQAGLPAGEIGVCYLVKPAKGEKDKFLVGIVRALEVKMCNRKRESGVNMQMYTLESANPEADIYAAPYVPVLPLTTP